MCRQKALGIRGIGQASVDLQNILKILEIGDRVCTEAGIEHEGIAQGTAAQQVIARATIEPVYALISIETIAPVSAGKPIVPRGP